MVNSESRRAAAGAQRADVSNQHLYRRHRPEETSPYPLIEENPDAFLEHLSKRDTCLPRFVGPDAVTMHRRLWCDVTMTCSASVWSSNDQVTFRFMSECVMRVSICGCKRRTGWRLIWLDHSQPHLLLCVLVGQSHRECIDHFKNSKATPSVQEIINRQRNMERDEGMDFFINSLPTTACPAPYEPRHARCMQRD